MQETRHVGTKGVPRAEREQLILDSATTEFGKLGYAGAALSAIAAQAGVSKPLVLTYFGSKEGLYVACVRRAGANLAEHIEAVADIGDTPRDKAAVTLDAIFEALAPRPHDWNVISDRTTTKGTPANDALREVRAVIAGQAARGVAAISTPTGLDADDVSALTEVWMSAVGALVGWWLRHPDRSATEMSARTRRVLAAVIGSA